MAIETNENKKFTFWSNMKETLDKQSNLELKCKIYDALVEYGLYGVEPEEDGSAESQIIAMVVQSLVPSLDKSKEYHQEQSEHGTKGGQNQKVSDEQLIMAIKEAAKEKGSKPFQQEIVDKLKELTGIKIHTKTIGRRFNGGEIEQFTKEALKEKENTKVGFNF